MCVTTRVTKLPSHRPTTCEATRMTTQDKKTSIFDKITACPEFYFIDYEQNSDGILIIINLPIGCAIVSFFIAHLQRNIAHNDENPS